MNRGDVLAHRGLLAGADSALENRFETLLQALGEGFGVETDVRYCSGRGHYLSHDPAVWTPQNDAFRFLEACHRHPGQVVALNLKELDGLRPLLRILSDLDLWDRLFLFDMELIESLPGKTARTLRCLDPRSRLAARVSERDEPVERAAGCPFTDCVWLDEFDGPWASQATFRELARVGKPVWAVSPDLHGRSLQESRRRWGEFMAWGARGICTDHPLELARCLELEASAGIGWKPSRCIT
ncbi:MAG: hypothetical protein ACOX9B_12825 [Candidatus Xenobium sp.]|jgi:hypothetical protein